MGRLAQARTLALAVPAALLAGAWYFQLVRHLAPCEMCHWQRWPHYAAVLLAAGAIGLAARPPLSRALTIAAAVAILASGAVAVLHAGVEYHWWTGPTRCSGAVLPAGGDPLKALLSAPLIRCDHAAWTLGGISLAGFNAIISILGGLAVLLLVRRPAR